MQANLERCGFQQQATVYGFPVQNFFRRETDRLIPYDIVFCDPPYASVPDLVTIIQRWRADWLTDDALVVIEHGKHTDLPSTLGPLSLVKRYDYGDTALSRFQLAEKGR
ncbi:MAG: putative Ribosomal RNA small subunit methyltransferase D [Nitrospira sp. OLB3]|nr:MAG: putative Ribosomal RNA small subunit methyltransferase D [Nitrospira sp. OLB3]